MPEEGPQATAASVRTVALNDPELMWDKPPTDLDTERARSIDTAQSQVIWVSHG